MGISYKENSSDLRNSKTIDLINFLINSKYNVEIFEPLLIDQDKNNFKKFNFVNPLKNKYDMIILTVPHNYFMKMGFKKIRSFGKKKFISSARRVRKVFGGGMRQAGIIAAGIDGMDEFKGEDEEPISLIAEQTKTGENALKLLGSEYEFTRLSSSLRQFYSLDSKLTFGY